MSAEERTSTGCSLQGALRLKQQRPNQHAAMSAKPATNTANPVLATSEFASEGLGGSTIPDARVGLGGHPLAVRQPFQPAVQTEPLRLPMVMQITGLARSTIYKLISQNQFPVPIRLSKRAVAWLQSEIENWVSSRVRAH